MPESEDLPSSQVATSRPSPNSKSPRPRKRPRQNTENVPTVILIDDDDQFDVTQVSPSKPTRAAKPPTFPVPICVLDDSEDEELATRLPNVSRLRGALSGDVILWKSSAERQQQQVKQDVAMASADCSRESGGESGSTRKEILSPKCVEPNVQLTETADVQLPAGFEYPSPPTSSEGSVEGKHAPKLNGTEKEPVRDPEGQCQSIRPAANAKHSRLPTVVDSFDAPGFSQDSACFSFSKQKSRVDSEAKQSAQSPDDSKEQSQIAARGEEAVHSEERTSAAPRKRYYTRTFEYVLTEVLQRCDKILRPDDIELASLLQRDISPNALALFVRLYRRKRTWHRVDSFETSYGSEIDVGKAIVELCEHRLLSSSHYAAKVSKQVSLIVAKEVITSLRTNELKAVCSSFPDGEHLKRLRARELLPALQQALVDDQSREGNEKRFRQTTLTGVSPRESLMRSVLKKAGHCVKLPDHALVSLERIHFLFFLEDGHDSPNLILADTGKVRFPVYDCSPNRTVFPSAIAFEEYEAAIRLESRLNSALERKDYSRAAHFGSIAELEVREQLLIESSYEDRDTTDLAYHSREYEGPMLTQETRTGSALTPGTKRLARQEAAKDLKHPFLRRYTAPWVYARAAWHSVHALERLGEYENAVQRLELLLSTNLMGRRRGKCLNRLTINLFKHLGKLQEPLNIILTALRKETLQLQFGDQIALANRGIAIHRKVTLPHAEKSARRSTDTKAAIKRVVASTILASRPEVLSQTLSKAATKTRVRKIFGKSIQVSRRERRRQKEQDNSDPWTSFRDENSRDSLNSLSNTNYGIMGKSVFKSLGTNGQSVSVEGYCLQWYLGKEGWNGVHDEGSSVRFLYALLLWDSALFAAVDDVFQTPYQDRPLDLFTEAFYASRKEDIEARLQQICAMKPSELRDNILELYNRFENTKAVGCPWSNYSAEDLSVIGAGLGGPVLAHCCRLLSQDYTYWGGGLPDLTLWKSEAQAGHDVFQTRLVEVKSARDVLSEKQRAWLIELELQGADCEVCKVVEKATERNSSELQESTLDSIAVSAIDAAEAGEEDPD